LQALHGGSLTVSQLVEVCAMKRANVSKHLGVLHDHHLVKRRRAGTSVCYQFAAPLIFSLCDLVRGKMKRDTQCAAALFHPEI
jgi:DNA-binding transcriptional ArsR family regulator